MGIFLVTDDTLIEVNISFKLIVIAVDGYAHFQISYKILSSLLSSFSQVAFRTLKAVFHDF